MKIELIEIERVLKETYLEIANNYSVADLHTDNDKVACIASAFRDKALQKLIKEL